MKGNQSSDKLVLSEKNLLATTLLFRRNYLFAIKSKLNLLILYMLLCLQPRSFD